jgi:Fe-S cluster assembly iron-binding protein IscA
MIQMTDKAGEYLLQLLEEQDSSPQSEYCFRIGDRVELGFELSLATKVEGDITLAYKNRTVIAIDANVAARFQDMTLDFVDKHDGSPNLVLVEGA